LTGVIRFIIDAGLVVPLFIFFRILGMFLTGPVFSSSRLPSRYRVSGALILSLAPVANNSFVWSVGGASRELAFGGALIGELGLGLLIGVVTSLFLESYRLTGTILDTASRTQSNVACDALGDEDSGLLSRIAMTFAFLMFLLADLHHVLIKGVYSSFAIFPPGGASLVDFGENGVSLLIQATGCIFSTSLRFALPPLFILFVFQIFLNIISFSAPSLADAFSDPGWRSTFAIGISLVTLYLASTYVLPLVVSSFSFIGIDGGAY
jgi:flagellar biosynthetic protein FliR